MREETGRETKGSAPEKISAVACGHLAEILERGLKAIFAGQGEVADPVRAAGRIAEPVVRASAETVLGGLAKRLKTQLSEPLGMVAAQGVEKVIGPTGDLGAGEPAAGGGNA